ncbi:MAG: DNA replication/repair protein RecF [Clostridia bacterium]|nr:DNA replication/repair protein RecF [Clostridia bacterium]
MKIKSTELIGFRNIDSELIEFSDGVNVIYGDNAQGKTNILEGIYIFARGRSFRASKDKELIKFGSQSAYSLLKFENSSGPVTLGVEISQSKPKSFYRNNVKVSRTSEIIGEFRAVLFCPSHLGIISDSPSVRRSFLDVAISQLKPDYIRLLAKYNNYIMNRNAVLKREETEEINITQLLDVYSEELATLSAEISLIRDEYIKRLDYWVKEFFKDMTDGKEIPTVTYDANHSIKDSWSKEEAREKYLTLYNSNREREIKYGSTLYGIHKDDLKIDINGRDSRLYASQGQQRSLALAMKMAEGEISREYTNEYPVFLLDDVLSELDEKRKQYILSSIDNKQVIITTCEPSVFDSYNENMIRIKEGRKI